MSFILVVDDESPIRVLCTEIFKKDGHEVLAVSSGEEALRTLSARKPDLVLMDIQIPGENGLSLLKRFPNDQRNKVDVAVFSGFVTQEIEKQAYAAGAIDVIPKAIGGAELSQRVKSLLEAQKRRREAPPKKSDQEKILVVDDEEGIRNLLRGFFEDRGYPTILAKNGEEAVAAVTKEKPTMILMDVNMPPGMNGIETLKKIRAIDTKVGVVMATGVQDDRTTKAALALGVYAFVSKPFDMRYLDLVVLTRLIMAS